MTSRPVRGCSSSSNTRKHYHVGCLVPQAPLIDKSFINSSHFSSQLFDFCKLVCLSAKVEHIGKDDLGRLAFEDLREAYAKLLKINGVREIIIVHKCNCVEMYVVVSKEKSEIAIDNLLDVWCKGRKDGIKIYAERDALLHLFKTTTSLESVILGDNQVMGQMRKSYASAAQFNACGKILRILFQSARNAAKRIKDETKLHHGWASIERVSAQTLKVRFGNVRSPKILVVGMGRMGRLVANVFHKQFKDVTVTTRNVTRLNEFMEKYGVKTISWDSIKSRKNDFDALVFVTSSPSSIFSACEFLDRQLIIDLGNPPNISGERENIISLLEIRARAQDVQKQRSHEREKADEIIQNEIHKTIKKVQLIESQAIKSAIIKNAFKLFKDLGSKKENSNSIQDKEFVQALLFMILESYISELFVSENANRSYSEVISRMCFEKNNLGGQ